jgi:hypothetical protein
VDIPKVLDSAKAFMESLVWKRIGQVLVLLLFAALGTIFWLNRLYFAEYVRPSKIAPERQALVIADSGKNAIDDVLKKPNNIVAIFVVSANMERNTRRIIFFRTTDPEIQRQQTEFENTHATTDVPLFNDDAENNKRVIAYINGEFVCSDFKVTQAAKYLIGVNAKYVCATAVPPIYGKFRGTVVAVLKVIPDADETTRLKILLRDLSDRLDNPSSSK